MNSPSVNVLIIAPGNLQQVYQLNSETAQYHTKEPPVFALMMAGYLRRQGFGVFIMDQAAENLTAQEIAKEAALMRPTLAVLSVYGNQPSASTQNMPAARAVAQALREASPTTPILMTGTHPSALPRRTIEEEPVDFVADGEGPVTVKELLLALRTREGLSRVRGLWYRSGGQLIACNPPAPNLQDLDQDIGRVLPWDLLPMKKYVAHEWHTGYAPGPDRFGYASIITSLGCPFRCEFCCIQSPFKAGEQALGFTANVNTYRRRSPEAVVEEVAFLADRYGIRHVKVHDEMFVLNAAHVRGITSGIRQVLGDSLNIWAYTRIDTTKQEFLSDLRSAGFRWLGIGIEAANSKVRDGQDKSFSDEKIFETIRRVHDAGIHVGGNYIFGLPEDTHESMQATLDLAKDLNTAYANFYCAMAYPGSPLHKKAASHGWPLPENPGGPGWIGYSQHSRQTFPLQTATLSAREVLAFRDRAWAEYYTRPQLLSLLRDNFGEAAVETVNGLVARGPLKRDLLA